MILDQRLVHSVNSGRCFALVGSGPSCELGYPSWAKLAEGTYHQLVAGGLVKDAPSYDKFLQNRMFPELLRQAEIDAGGRIQLIEIVKSLLVPAPGGTGYIYDYLVKWPFACYLTTNFDDELQKRLAATGCHYQTVWNRVEDFYAIRDGASHLVVKLHSDLQHPAEAVLTSEDYQRVATSDGGKYFRDKLRSIMETFDVCIIGHSMSDCDLRLVLQTAKDTASPDHPIFMLAADFTPGEEREAFERYNIVVTTYDNADSQHGKLRKILSLGDKFIRSRKQRFDAVARPTPSEEVEAATSLLIFRRLRNLQAQGGTSPAEYAGPLILQALKGGPARGVATEKLMSRSPLKAAASNSNAFRSLVEDALRQLVSAGLVDAADTGFVLSRAGLEQLQEVSSIRAVEEDQAYGQFLTVLKSLFPRITQDQSTKSCELLRQTIVRVFKKRGLSIANAVFAGQSVSPEDLSLIFSEVSDATAQLAEDELRAAFIDAAHGMIVEPNDPQKQYLASVSQGYFLYHMVGLDPTCSKIRRDVFGDTAWLCDSSVLIPLLAVGCHSHDYARDLFTRLKSLRGKLYTTKQLLQEAWEHLNWMLKFVEREAIDSPEFLEAAMLKAGYKQNLFLDGFIRFSAEGKVSTFRDYLDVVFPHGPSRKHLEDQIAVHSISVLDLGRLAGFKDEDLREVGQHQATIHRERVTQGTYRSDLQVEAEAEVLQIIQGVRSGRYEIPFQKEPFSRTYFLSHSRLLDRIMEQAKLITWTPEALYRYVTALPGEVTDADLLHQCMLHEYYVAGVSFVDKPRYLKFFGPSINAAQLSFKEQKAKYLEELEETGAAHLDEAFDRMPDLEKPFFVAQMGWRVAKAAEHRAEEATRRATEAEARAEKVRAETEATWKSRQKKREQQIAAERRHQKDPKHLKKLLRQAKKRAKRKK